MIREIIHDPIFLAVKSNNATFDDIPVAEDLLETLISHKDECVGMAANMIGVRKRIICFDNAGEYMTMLNPEIIKASDSFEAKEGCLSLLGGPRSVKRFKKFKVRYQTLSFETRIKSFDGWTEQIIQNEIDQCNGILI